MSNIEVGDKVKCINIGRLFNHQRGQTPPLKLNGLYIVNRITTCECGLVSYDVGLVLTSDMSGTNCPCGATKSPHTGIWWCNAKRFVKEQTNNASVEEQIEEAVKKEDYELAAKLKKQCSESF